MKIGNLVKIAIAALLLMMPLSATIINIPADYPTIQAGVDASSNGDTVLVSPGTYVENINFNGHNIVLGSLFMTTGDTSYISQTVIDGDSSGSVVAFTNGENSDAIITGFTLTNGRAACGGGIYCLNADPTISWNNITYNDAYAPSGGGVYCANSNATISHNFLYHNSAYQTGGGIFFTNSPARLIGNRIERNSVGRYLDGFGGGICCYNNSDIFMINNLILANISEGIFWSDGGGICCSGSTATLINNTITGNITHWGYCGGFYGSGTSTIANCIIRGNSSNDLDQPGSITYSNIGHGWPGEGNISADPLFRAPDNGDFHLMAIACGDPFDSPCIDRGAPTLIDTLLDCDWGLGTERSDMGAYGGGEGFVGIDEPIENLPSKVSLSQNYPNPFNTSTLIKYELPKQSQVTIDIYDVLGHRISTLEDAVEPAGYHELIWKAEGLSSGVYFYRLQTGEYIETRKMMLIK